MAKRLFPSLGLTKLTTGLPWTHCTTASITSHSELSFITGTRAMSGSDAGKVQELVGDDVGCAGVIVNVGGMNLS